jgi:PhzF family phenazine biosynthesis protein
MMRFTQVDVFGDGGVTGNPLAVVHEADGLDDAAMQAFASWTNLSETTFLLPASRPGADYRVRIFTGTGELPFAGHPTLGTAFAWLAAGGRPAAAGEVVQECGVGLVRVRTDGDRLSFAAPARRRSGPLDAASRAVAEATLGVPQDAWVSHEWGDNGPPWMMVELADDAAVRTLRPDLTQLGVHQHLGVVGRGAGAYAYEVRGFVGRWEDPVTGSLNAAVAQWLRGRGVVPSGYVATQGSQLGRHGEIFVTDDGTDVWIGGRVRSVIAGSVDL